MRGWCITCEMANHTEYRCCSGVCWWWGGYSGCTDLRIRKQTGIVREQLLPALLLCVLIIGVIS